MDLKEILPAIGYLGIFSIVFAESGLFIGFFLPGDSLLFTAGFLASQGIFDIKILDYKWPYLKINVVCGSGTYIRSLARDIGEKLGCGGYLANLIRTRVGKFKIVDAKKLEDL